MFGWVEGITVYKSNEISISIYYIMFYNLFGIWDVAQKNPKGEAPQREAGLACRSSCAICGLGGGTTGSKRPTWDSDSNSDSDCLSLSFSLVPLSPWDSILWRVLVEKWRISFMISLHSKLDAVASRRLKFGRNARSIWAPHVPWRPSLHSSSNYDVFFRQGKNWFLYPCHFSV